MNKETTGEQTLSLLIGRFIVAGAENRESLIGAIMVAGTKRLLASVSVESRLRESKEDGATDSAQVPDEDIRERVNPATMPERYVDREYFTIQIYKNRM